MDSTAAEFRSAAIRLKEADRSLMLLTRRRIRLATLPVAKAVRQSALEILPKRGGLNVWVADSIIKTSILTGRRTAGVALQMRKTGHQLREIDSGFVRHPVYGNPEVWATQRVTPGFFWGPVKEAQPLVAEECMAALRDAARIAGFK